MNRAMPRFAWSFIGGGMALGALAALLTFSATAREVATETAATLFGIVSSPFALEATLALCFLSALILYNQWRLKKEGDGWVYLVSQEPDASLSPSASQRLEGVVLATLPEPVDEAQTTRSLVEGYLELGMAAQAQQELAASPDLPDDAATTALRIRVLAANLGTEEALALLRLATTRWYESHAQLAQLAHATVETCQWFAQHLPQHQHERALWQEQARHLGVLDDQVGPSA
ncbi:MAG: hypothetical protein ACOYMN_05995 [Roseimicrobium sp.]